MIIIKIYSYTDGLVPGTIFLLLLSLEWVKSEQRGGRRTCIICYKIIYILNLVYRNRIIRSIFSAFYQKLIIIIYKCNINYYHYYYEYSYAVFCNLFFPVHDFITISLHAYQYIVVIRRRFLVSSLSLLVVCTLHAKIVR